MYEEFVVPKPGDDEQTLVAKALGRQALRLSYIGSRRFEIRQAAEVVDKSHEAFCALLLAVG